MPDFTPDFLIFTLISRKAYEISAVSDLRQRRLDTRGGATTVRPRTVIIACQRHVTRCGTLMHPRGNAISSVRFSVLCSALATAPSREAM